MKPLVWIGSSRDDLHDFPEPVEDDMGFALFQAQIGGKHASAKPLKGFRGAGVVEVVENHDGDTYRAVYTVRFEEAVYVLHCFQKKSSSGIKTSKRDIDLIESRLKTAEGKHQEWQSSQGKKDRP